MCTALLAPTAQATEVPPRDSFYLSDEIGYGGSGCPQGTVSADVSEDGEAVSIFLDEYIAKVGPDTSPSVTKACNLSVPLHIPAGWQFSIVSVGYRGTVYLEEGVRATQRSEYFFQGERTGPKLTSRWYGPTADERDLDITDRVFLSEGRRAWSPCSKQRDLIIRTRLQANNARNRDGFGYIENDYIEVYETYSTVLDFDIEWRRCI